MQHILPIYPHICPIMSLIHMHLLVRYSVSSTAKVVFPLWSRIMDELPIVRQAGNDLISDVFNTIVITGAKGRQPFEGGFDHNLNPPYEPTNNDMVMHDGEAEPYLMPWTLV